jgi:hypothetical protein
MSDYSPVTAPEIKYKHPDESILYAADFERNLEDGETLSSGANASQISATYHPEDDDDIETGTPENLTIANIAISGTKVRFRVSEGTHKYDYELLVTVITTNPANTRKLRVRIWVRDQ